MAGFISSGITLEQLNKTFFEYLCVAPLSIALVRACEVELVRASIQKYQFPIDVDVGIGDGIFDSQLKNHISLGLDADPNEIKRGRSRVGALVSQWVQSDIRSLPFKSRSCRGILANSVLEHIPQIDQAMAEISRTLKPEGFFILSVPINLLSENLFIFRFLKKSVSKTLALKYSNLFNQLFAHHNLDLPEEWEGRFQNAELKLVEKTTYLGMKLTAFHELSIISALPSFFWKKIFHRWILWPNFRAKVTAPMLLSIFRFKNFPWDRRGSSCFMIARKKGD